MGGVVLEGVSDSLGWRPHPPATATPTCKPISPAPALASAPASGQGVQGRPHLPGLALPGQGSMRADPPPRDAQGLPHRVLGLGDPAGQKANRELVPLSTSLQKEQHWMDPERPAPGQGLQEGTGLAPGG